MLMPAAGQARTMFDKERMDRLAKLERDLFSPPPDSGGVGGALRRLTSPRRRRARSPSGLRVSPGRVGGSLPTAVCPSCDYKTAWYAATRAQVAPRSVA